MRQKLGIAWPLGASEVQKWVSLEAMWTACRVLFVMLTCRKCRFFTLGGSRLFVHVVSRRWVEEFIGNGTSGEFGEFGSDCLKNGITPVIWAGFGADSMTL